MYLKCVRSFLFNSGKKRTSHFQACRSELVLLCLPSEPDWQPSTSPLYLRPVHLRLPLPQHRAPLPSPHSTRGSSLLLRTCTTTIPPAVSLLSYHLEERLPLKTLPSDQPAALPPPVVQNSCTLRNHSTLAAQVGGGWAGHQHNNISGQSPPSPSRENPTVCGGGRTGWSLLRGK